MIKNFKFRIYLTIWLFLAGLTFFQTCFGFFLKRFLATLLKTAFPHNRSSVEDLPTYAPGPVPY